MLYLFLELTIEQINDKIRFNRRLITKLSAKRQENIQLYLLTGETIYMDRVIECDRMITDLCEELQLLCN